MQVVEGRFDSVINFLLDSNIADIEFQFTLAPGRYQWRVRGVNSVSATDFATYNVFIDSSLILTNQRVILTDPLDLSNTNSTSVTLRWKELLNAEDYLVEVRQGDFTTGATVFGPERITSNSINITLPEGSLQWGIQANNSVSNSSTAFFIRTLVIDTTKPLAPTLIFPLAGATLGDSTNTFTWQQATDTGTELVDRISFYEDQNATTLIRTLNANGTAMHNDSLGIGTFFWAIESVDAAGNTGQRSEIRSIIIQ